MAFTTGLYYPWIQIRDERWLATAVLYWETLRTIVPRGMPRPYRNKTSRELFDAGVLLPISVHSNDNEISGLADEVIAYLNSDAGAEMLVYRNAGRQDEIHVSKLPHRVQEVLLHRDKLPFVVRYELGRFTRRRGDWLTVSPDFGAFYMTLLASKLSERHGLGLLTSSMTADGLATKARAGATFAAATRDHPAARVLAEGTLAQLLIQTVSIAPDIPLKKLIRFRQKHADELGRLRSKIGELVSAIEQPRSLAAIQQYANDLVTNEVQPALNDLRGALRGSRIKFLADTLLKTSFLSAAPTSALVVAGLAVPTALAVGAAVSLVAAAALYAVDKQSTIRSNPFAYVLSLERELSRAG